MKNPPYKKPRIAITLGDPAGVGPELCWKLLAETEILRICEPMVIGEREVILDAVKAGSLPAECVRSMGMIRTGDFTPGTVSAACGAAAYVYVREGIRMCLAGEADALVTGPIHKEALRMAGVPFPGHTEILAAETRTAAHVMMLTSAEITAALVTAHVGYADVPAGITAERVRETITLTAEVMRRILGRQHVKLTVCGLNPHAGEHGLFGYGEEERFILPAILETRSETLTITGPLPPDTAFLPARRKETDAYICMTHDQGLIPLKMLAFDSAVNITLGLPIIRTSVDHGTAMDIARTGKASVGSFLEAVRLAVKLCNFH